MSRKKGLKLKKYNLTDNLYRELYYFCLQYDEKKEKIKSFTSLSAIAYNGMPQGNRISNPTEKQGIYLYNLKRDIELIEQSALESDSYLYPWIIKSVTKDMSYNYLAVPSGRRQFYEKRREFFRILAEKKIFL